MRGGCKKTAGVSILFFLLLLPASAHMLRPFFDAEPGIAFQPPSPDHPLGTDEIGRDILISLIQGARTSITVGFAAAFLATLAGTFVGIVSGYLRGPVDGLLMWLCNVFFLIPSLPLMIVIGAFFRPGMHGIIICIALLGWAATARVVRSKVLQVREMPFILTALSMGASHSYIMFRHVLPNVMELVLARASLSIAGAMLMEAGISFLGLGDPVHISWGTILYKAFSHGGIVNGYIWWYLPPILCISWTILGFTVIGLVFKEHPESKARYVPARGNMDIRRNRKCETAFIREDRTIDEDVLLSVQGLNVDLDNGSGGVSRVLDGIDLQVKEHEKTAVIGETGSGKSVLLLTLIRLLPAHAGISGKILFRGTSILDCGEQEMRRLRGRRIAYVPQGAGNALNPVLRIVDQVAEPIAAHQGLRGKEAKNEARRLMQLAGLEEAESRGSDYPHRYSGGMIQRALIAMALAEDADLMLVDEPTKGLDAGKRKELQTLFQSLDKKAMLIVTHNLEFAENCTRKVVVMHAGRIVEVSDTLRFFEDPLHPFSRALIDALPARGLCAQPYDTAGYGKTVSESGCPFRPSCNTAFHLCNRKPPLFERDGRQVRCWRYSP